MALTVVFKFVYKLFVENPHTSGTIGSVGISLLSFVMLVIRASSLVSVILPAGDVAI